MRRFVKDNDQLSNADSLTSNSSFIISDKEIQRARKKKKAAFQSFLSKPQPDPQQNFQKKRKLSDHEIEQGNLDAPKCCNICNKILSDRVKVCQFCRQTLCVIHFRKARRNPNTNKFSRICDLCEDKYLMEKHYRNQMKTEETIVSEEQVVTIKYNKIKTELEEKRRKISVLKEKNKQISQSFQNQLIMMANIENNINKQQSLLEKKRQENNQLEKKLHLIQKRKPPSLESDYHILKKQKDRIQKDFNKIKKQYDNAIKHKGQVQNRMYEDLYEWQLMQKYKKKTEQKKMKDDQCKIY